MVRSYYPVLALLLSEGISGADCFRLPRDPCRVFDLLQTFEGRRELSFVLRKPVPDIPWKLFDAHLEAIERSGAGVITCLDEDYPACFREISNSPAILFYKGDASLMSRRGVAIVGSRKASVRGVAFTRSLAADLAGFEIMVVSGAARGIDAAAHRGALEAEGDTVAVLGTGIDVPYPPENAELLGTIAANGCVLTEQLTGGLPLKHVFPQRNRLISALSHVVVVVEAACRSGALITAKWALEQGRDVGVVPGFPGDGRSSGGNSYLKMGAFPVEGVNDIICAVPALDPKGRTLAAMSGAASSLGIRRGPDLCDNTRAVLDVLSSSPADTDSIARHLGIPAAGVLQALLDLEMKGLIAREPSGLYVRID